MITTYFNSFYIIISLVCIGYLSIGAAVLDNAMAFIRKRSGWDCEFRRMALEDNQRAAVMRVAQLAVLAGWPFAVLSAIIANYRRQSYISTSL